MRRLDDIPGRRRAYLYRFPETNSRLAVFMHGLTGGYLGGWIDALDGLAEGAPDWDFLFLGCDLRRVGAFLDVADVIGAAMIDARQGRPPFRRSYQRFALLGRSSGALGIRQLLCSPPSAPAGPISPDAAALFDSPASGLPADGLSGVPEFADATAADAPAIRMLRRWTRTVRAAPGAPPTWRFLTEEDAMRRRRVSGEFDWPGDGEPVVYRDDRRPHAPAIRDCVLRVLAAVEGGR